MFLAGQAVFHNCFSCILSHYVLRKRKISLFLESREKHKIIL